MNYVGSYLTQRNKNEFPFVHARMRDLQGWFIQNLILVKKDIYINSPRFVTFIFSDPAHLGFDHQDPSKQP